VIQNVALQQGIKNISN